MVSLSRYHRAVAGGSSIIKVWQVISLTVQHIINGFRDALLIPEPPLAALVGPGTERVRPESILPQLPGCVRFKRVQHQRRLPIRGDHGMDVICPHIDCQQTPSPFVASFTDRRFNRPALTRSQYQWLGLQLLFVVLTPFLVGRNVWRAVAIVKTIDRPSLVSVQPGTVGAKRYEVRQRRVGVIPHDEDEEPD